MTTMLRRAVGGLRWYVRELSGEAKWDEYVEHCRRHGHPPMTRREFERRRADQAEAAPQARCC